MNGTQILASIKRGLLKLFSVAGRDTRPQFWPYALLLILVQFAVSMVFTVRTMVGAMGTAFQAAQSAEGGQVDQAALQAQIAQSMIGEMQQTIIISGAIGLIFTALMIAATVRRLHDRDWSGWWIAIPFAGQMFGLYNTQRVMAAMTNATDIASISAASGTLGTLIGIVNIGAYIFLLVQLVQVGSPGDNRFGPGESKAEWPE